MPAPTSASLRDALPRPDEATLESALARVAPVGVRPPFGSGEAEEIALRRGWKPVVRQLLRGDQLERKRVGFEREGFFTAVGNMTVVRGAGAIGKHKGMAQSIPRTPFFVGRDAARVEEAAAIERVERGDDRVLGTLLGFPSCCIEAFMQVPRPRGTMMLLHASNLATHGPGDYRLNVCDLRLFHFLPWIPCSFRCEASIAYASQLEAYVAAREPAFAIRTREALSAARLVLHPDVQLSMRGARQSNRFVIESVWPSARDHHPDVHLDADTREAVARLLVAVERASEIDLSGPTLAIAGIAAAPLADSLLVEFAP